MPVTERAGQIYNVRLNSLSTGTALGAMILSIASTMMATDARLALASQRGPPLLKSHRRRNSCDFKDSFLSKVYKLCSFYRIETLEKSVCLEQSSYEDWQSPKAMRYRIEMMAKRFSANRSELLAQTAELLLRRTVQEAERRGGISHAEAVVTEALDLIHNLDKCLNYYVNSSPAYDLWLHKSHQNILLGQKYSNNKIIIVDLGSIAADYVAQPWMQLDYIDWCIVDSLVFSEWTAFSFSIDNPYKQNLERDEFNNKLKHRAIYSASIAFAGFAVTRLLTKISLYNSIAFSLLLFCALAFEAVIYIKLERIKRMEEGAGNRRVVGAMLNAYTGFDGAVLSPTRVRDGLLAAEAAGAAWPTEIWPILEAAIARNPSIWNVSKTRASIAGT